MLQGTGTAGHLKRNKSELPVLKKVALIKKSTHVKVKPENSRESEKTKETSKEGAEETVGLKDINGGCAGKLVIGSHAPLHATRYRERKWGHTFPILEISGEEELTSPTRKNRERRKNLKRNRKRGKKSG